MLDIMAALLRESQTLLWRARGKDSSDQGVHPIVGCSHTTCQQVYAGKAMFCAGGIQPFLCVPPSPRVLGLNQISPFLCV